MKVTDRTTDSRGLKNWVAGVGLATVIVGVGVGVTFPVAAQAAAPTKAGVCDDSGDLCEWMTLKGGVLTVGQTLAANYGKTAKVCAIDPRGRSICQTRPIVNAGTNTWIARFIIRRPARGVWRVGAMDAPARLRVP